MDYFDELLLVLQALDRHGVDYVLIGGAALNVHGLVRATEDIDLFLKPTASNVEGLKEALRSIWNDDSLDEITSDDLLGDYPVIRYGPPDSTLYLDLFSRIGDVATFEDLQAETIVISGVSVRVATPATLYRLKSNTLRPIDRSDALRLAQAFDFDPEEP